jgi:TRAP-type mannitol/chloroaromatic compound transport system permease large subunit
MGGAQPLAIGLRALLAGAQQRPRDVEELAVKAVAEPDVTFGDIVVGCIPFVVMMIIVCVILIFVPVILTLRDEEQ